VGNKGYAVSKGSVQTILFGVSVLTFNTAGIGIGTRSLVLLGPSSIVHDNVFPGYIIAGMGVVHENILPGTVVQSYSHIAVRETSLILSQATLSVGDPGYSSGLATGTQSLMFTPCSFDTGSVGIGSGVKVILMGGGNRYVHVGIVLFHPNLWPGTTVSAVDVLSLTLSQAAISVGDAAYIATVGVQTIQFAPLRYTTDFMGISAGIRSIVMSLSSSSNNIVHGMRVFHPNLWPENYC
jgi:hypothetical protein